MVPNKPTVRIAFGAGITNNYPNTHLFPVSKVGKAYSNASQKSSGKYCIPARTSIQQLQFKILWLSYEKGRCLLHKRLGSDINEDLNPVALGILCPLVYSQMTRFGNCYYYSHLFLDRAQYVSNPSKMQLSNKCSIPGMRR